MTKSQEESEKPAKVYQLDAVIKELADIRTDMNSQLGTILSEVKGVVTTTQLEKEILASEKRTEAKINTVVKDIHLKYGGTKTTVDKWSKFVWGVMGSLVVTFIGQLILLVYVFVSGKT